MSAILNDQDTQTLRVAAWGAVSLMSAAGAAGSAHRAATEGSIATITMLRTPAEVVGSTEGAARVHYHNAMRAMKELLYV